MNDDDAEKVNVRSNTGWLYPLLSFLQTPHECCNPVQRLSIIIITDAIAAVFSPFLFKVTSLYLITLRCLRV